MFNDLVKETHQVDIELETWAPSPDSDITILINIDNSGAAECDADGAVVWDFAPSSEVV